MKSLLHSLTAAGIAALTASASPRLAGASTTTPIPHRDGPGSAGGTAVRAENAAESNTTAQTKRLRVMLKGYDPVAYFKQGKAVKGTPAFMSSYHGVTYLFASAADKAAFDQNPSRFEPQYGGFCAASMAQGKRNDIDPHAFYLHHGKLYLCTSAAGLDGFRKNPDANIAKADKNWLTIGPEAYNSVTMEVDRPWPFGPQSNER